MSDEDGYTGPATLTVDGRPIPVHVVLDARYEPQDGRLHWFGRMRTAAEGTPLESAARDGTVIELQAGAGPVPARLGDTDPWGRIRVTGVGPTPYPVSRAIQHGESGKPAR
jgi:hypothetical protein